MSFSNKDIKKNFKNFFKNRIFAYLSISTLILVLYYPSFECHFWTEDFALIDYVKNNFSFYNTFVTNFFNGLFYRPLPNDISFLISYTIFELNSAGYKIINIILFILNSILVYEITILLTKSKFLAFTTSIIYLTRGAHLKAIYWIAAGFQTNGVAFWMFSTVLLYLQYIKSKNKLFYISSLLCSIFAMLTKEIGIVLPALILLTEAYTQRSKQYFNFKNLVLRIIPFSLITLLFYLPRIYILRSLILNSPYEMQFSLVAFFKNIAYYAFNSFNNYLEIFLLGTLILITLISSKNRKYALFSVAWFFIGLLPHLFIATHNECYYLATSLFGFSIILSIGLRCIYEKFGLCSIKYSLTIVLLSVCIISARINIDSSKYVKKFHAYQQSVNTFLSDLKQDFPSFPDNSLIYIKDSPSYLVRLLGWGGVISLNYKNKVTVYFEGNSKKLPAEYDHIYYFKFDENDLALKFIPSN